jgi:hypothetical protein
MALARAIFTIGEIGVDRIHQDQYWCSRDIIGVGTAAGFGTYPDSYQGIFFQLPDPSSPSYRRSLANTVFSW